MLDELIDRFSKKAPAAVMLRATFSRVFSAETIDLIFSEHRERQVEGQLLFSSLVALLVPVVAGSKPSVFAAHKDSDLEVSRQAVYDKLKGVESQVSAALLRTPAAELQAIKQKAGALNEDIVRGFHTFVIDGKKFDGTEHRLSETRRIKSAPLPGMAVTMLDTRSDLFIDIECEPDAYRCERKVVEPMFSRLHAGALYVADANFCDGPLISQFIKAKTYFLVRHHGRSPSWRTIDGSERESKRKDAAGNRIYEQEIDVTLPDGSWKRVRRITVKLSKKNRKGDTEIHLLTNLPKRVSAAAISHGYAKRWTIETCLGHLAQALNAEISTLCYPAAAELCFSLALTLFNLLSTIKSILAQYGKQPKKDKPIGLSYYYLACEITQTEAGLRIAIDDEYWRVYETMPLRSFLSFIKSVAKQADLKRYQSNPRGPKKKPPKRKSGKRRAHVATQRILAARK